MASPTVLDTFPVAMTATSATPVNTFSQAFTSASGGQNRLLYFQLGVAAGISGVSATYNGSSLTIGTIYAGAQVQIVSGYLANPPSGSNTFTVSWTGSGAADLYVVTLQDAAQTSAIDQTANNGTGGGQTLTTNITTGTDNCLLLDFVMCNTLAGTFTPNAAQTSLVTQSDLSGQSAAGSFKAVGTAGAFSMNWTTLVSHAWDTQVIAIKYLAPSPASSQTLYALSLLGVGQ